MNRRTLILWTLLTFAMLMLTLVLTVSITHRIEQLVIRVNANSLRISANEGRLDAIVQRMLEVQRRRRQ